MNRHKYKSGTIWESPGHSLRMVMFVRVDSYVIVSMPFKSCFGGTAIDLQHDKDGNFLFTYKQIKKFFKGWKERQDLNFTLAHDYEGTEIWGSWLKPIDGKKEDSNGSNNQ